MRRVPSTVTNPKLPGRNLLSIDFEDYFHGPALAKTVTRRRWNGFEARLEQNCLNVLSRLDQVGSQATFFVTPWVAKRRPDLLTAVVTFGHEIALAGPRGQSFRLLSRVSLRDRVRRDRNAVEDACGKRVIGYRVADILLRPRHMWALEVLAEEGFLYDSSVSPFLTLFARQPWRQLPHLNKFATTSLWEFPLSSQRVAGIMIPFAGGNYFRQFPEWLVYWALRRHQQPLALYFRLWDFDPDQPRLNTGSALNNMRHYRNSHRILRMIDRLLTNYQFVSFADYLNTAQEDVELGFELETSREPKALRSGKLARVPVSVIVPCFNEEAGIPYLVNTLVELKQTLADEYDVQLIIVDDGSTDKTWLLLCEYFANRPDTLIVRHPRNLGVAAAITTGLRQSHEIACSIDCDCSYDPTELKAMLKLLTDGVDLVTASPYHPAGSVLNVPKWRQGLSRMASVFYRIVTGRRLYTFTACFRVYRRSIALQVPLHNSGFLGVAELAGRLTLQDKRIVEHPTILEARLFGQSKMKVLRTISAHLRLLAQLAWLRLGHQTGHFLGRT